MKNTEKVSLNLLVLDFNYYMFQHEFSIVKIEENRDTLELDDYYKIIGCERIDITDYNDDIAIIVDDEGLFKENTFYTEFVAPDGCNFQLAGKLIFARNVYTENGTSLTGLTAGECFKLIDSIKPRLMGVRA
ncbi:DUF3846 domain-containing protein [Ornithinibacillus contaminans]|uniref:DUF3846 domain-containing protein n=1 Tax=Ornithinibacillus contaminans TaxID=694055 RepID=UPI00069F96C8|nr:hypothetical protein [Ornithinibacillus contaminans]